jgi:hypothetical protein
MVNASARQNPEADQWNTEQGRSAAPDSTPGQIRPTQLAHGQAATAPITSTAAVVLGVGVATVALKKTAWIPGLLLGVGAMLVPKLFPGFGTSMRPLLKRAVATGMVVSEKTREAVERGREEIDDLVAEIRAENQTEPTPEPPPQ